MTSTRITFASVILGLILLASSLEAAAAGPLLDLGPVIEAIVEELKLVLGMMKNAALGLGKVLAGAILAIGVVLWASDIFSYKGRRLIISGSILLIILELIT